MNVARVRIAELGDSFSNMRTGTAGGEPIPGCHIPP